MKKEILLQKLSHISRIKIEESEKENFASKISSLIDWSHKIDEVDTNNIAPLFNVLEWLGYFDENIREDKITVTDESNELVSNAPDKEDMFIAVPKVIE